MTTVVNLRCRCGNIVEVHHEVAVVAKSLAESVMAVHERWCRTEFAGDGESPEESPSTAGAEAGSTPATVVPSPAHGAGSSTGESTLATEVAGSSPAQPHLTAAELADAIEAFLAPMRCPPTPNTTSGMHCAECCHGTGWLDVHSGAETAAAEALDRALAALAAVRREIEGGDDAR